MYALSPACREGEDSPADSLRFLVATDEHLEDEALGFRIVPVGNILVSATLYP